MVAVSSGRKKRSSRTRTSYIVREKTKTPGETRAGQRGRERGGPSRERNPPKRSAVVRDPESESENAERQRPEQSERVQQVQRSSQRNLGVKMKQKKNVQNPCTQNVKEKSRNRENETQREQ